MSNKIYANFVKASSPEQCTSVSTHTESLLSGEEAVKMYLEEIGDINAPTRLHSRRSHKPHKPLNKANKKDELLISNMDIFLTVEHNNLDKLKRVLDRYPDKINITDDYGWSLLMTACQGNSVQCAEELLKRGIDISIRDRAGNSARSLIIKNKNYKLVDVLLKYKETESEQKLHTDKKPQIPEQYKCDICKKVFADREEHLSSTLHNICASKGKIIPASYKIPSSNRGYQLMLKGGWDRESGLGRDGCGKKYPIKTIQKKDRKGLGHEKKIHKEAPEHSIKYKSRQMFENKHRKSKQFEIEFRREFY